MSDELLIKVLYNILDNQQVLLKKILKDNRNLFSDQTCSLMAELRKLMEAPNG